MNEDLAGPINRPSEGFLLSLILVSTVEEGTRIGQPIPSEGSKGKVLAHGIHGLVTVPQCKVPLHKLHISVKGFHTLNGSRLTVGKVCAVSDLKQ
jgi:hypothetical protein